jgi:hypothetical protein
MQGIIVRTIAIFFIVLGLLTFPLPIPIGAISLLVGLSLLVSVSRRATRAVRQFRRKRPVLDKKMAAVEKKVPGFIRHALRKTRPRVVKFRRRVGNSTGTKQE